MSKTKAERFKGILQYLQTRSAFNFEKKNCHDCNPYRYTNVPCKSSAERGPVLSKYRFWFWGGGWGFPNKLNWSITISTFVNVVLHLTVSLYSKNCKYRRSLNLCIVLYPTCGIPENDQNLTFCLKRIVFNYLSVYF